MTTDGKLQALYFELGQHQKRCGELAKAADTYALALYYAKRTTNRELVQRCREEVALCNPSHIVCRESSAPLYFAQLLMRHPPEEAEQELQEMRQRQTTSALAPAHSASAPGTSVDELFQYAKVDPNCGIFELGATSAPSDAPTAWLTAIEEEALQRPEPLPETLPQLETPQRKATAFKTETMEAHHIYPHSTPTEPSTEIPTKAVDDYLFASQPSPRRAETEEVEESWMANLIHTGAVASLLLGVAAIGFFSVELYKSRARLDPARIVKQIRQANDRTGPAIEALPETNAAPVITELEDSGSLPTVPQIGQRLSPSQR